ncbi:MAG: hypothetical protein OER88_07120 [Planctomycetota bacterium]|nr:hypothetical protein [Planctomycetota bacterium]
MSEHADTSLLLYWKAWAALLVITLVMAFFTSTGVIVVGIAAKVTIIGAWFMHLKQERLDFVLYVAVSLVFFSLLLFGLIAPDGAAM